MTRRTARPGRTAAAGPADCGRPVPRTSPVVPLVLSVALVAVCSGRGRSLRCAGLAPPASGEVPSHVPPRVHRLVQQLGDAPVAVYATDRTLVGWNRMWTAAVGDPRTYGWDQGNLVDSIAAWPVRSWAGDEAEEEALVAGLRITAATHPDDTRLAALVDRRRRPQDHRAPRRRRPGISRAGERGPAAGSRADRVRTDDDLEVRLRPEPRRGRRGLRQGLQDLRPRWSRKWPWWCRRGSAGGLGGLDDEVGHGVGL